MAGRRQDLETRLIAKDDASKVIDKVAGELDAAREAGHQIELTADDKASADIRSLSQRLAGLSDEDKTIVLKAKVSDAERDIDRHPAVAARRRQDGSTKRSRSGSRRWAMPGPSSTGSRPSCGTWTAPPPMSRSTSKPAGSTSSSTSSVQPARSSSGEIARRRSAHGGTIVGGARCDRRCRWLPPPTMPPTMAIEARTMSKLTGATRRGRVPAAGGVEDHRRRRQRPQRHRPADDRGPRSRHPNSPPSSASTCETGRPAVERFVAGDGEAAGLHR